MGGKITIDSATLMNKGLEVIEAQHLFGVPLERIDVVVHPQSIVHALVHLNDGASLAHMGYPDMRVPISYALHYPERADVPVPTLDLAAVGRSPSSRPTRRPSRACGWRARRPPPAAPRPCVLNAANEVAVQAFLGGEIAFTAIAEVIERALDAPRGRPGAPLLRPLPRRHRGAHRRARADRGGAPRELVPRRARLHDADRPARAGPLRRREGSWACASSASRCSSRRCSCGRRSARPSTRSARSPPAAT